MEIFKVTKEKLGFDAKRFTEVLVICFIVLTVSFMASVMYQNSTFELSQVFNGNLDNLTDLTVDSFGNVLNETLDRKIGEESDSRNVSSGKEVLNGSVIPGVLKESDSRNISSQPNELTSDFKFLQGLYSLELDERSCLSRYQSILYRKPSTHNPSPYLISKLREYEDLHKLCGPYTKTYTKASKRLKSGRRSTSSKCKYIIWVPANGLGNRIISMAATFLYALLTNRVLLVDHGTDMADLFCEPFPNTSWLLPNGFPLKQQFGVTNIRHAYGFGSIAVNMSIKSRPTHLYLNLDHSDYDLDKKQFYCDKGEALLGKVTWLILLSDQYFSPSFFLSSSYKEEASKLFPEKDTIFFHLSHYLFSPSNQAWGLITRFYDAYLAKADKRVGLQIRVFHAQTTPFQIVMDQILACTMNEKILPQTEREENVDFRFRNKTSEAILVTSLHSEFYENLKDMYWMRSTVTGEVVGVYQASHEEYQHFGDNKHNMKAWVEMYLLSTSDVLVTSGFSTFGYVAQGLGGLRPWILYKTNGKKIRNPPCVRDISMEPCFHVPKIYNCQDEVKIDAVPLFPYLRHCQDRKGGVKLVAFPEGL